MPLEEKFEPNLIIASNRSPIDYKIGSEERISLGGLTQAIVKSLKPNDLWISVSQGDNDVNKVNSQGIIKIDGENSFLSKKIFLDPLHFKEFYSGLSNEFLWPLLHCNLRPHYESSPTFPKPKLDGNELLRYSSVNRRFAEEIVEFAGKNTTVWLQDYHLLLTPAKIKERNPNLPVGQFIHIPMFHPKTIEHYLTQDGKAREAVEQILKGMMANDLLGFHIPEYVQNFANAVSTIFPHSKIEETSKDSFKISYTGDICHVESFPIGTDVEGITSKSSTKLNIPYKEKNLKNIIEEDKKNNRKVFVGLERGDYTKGLVERLEIIDSILEMNQSLPKEESIGDIHYIGVVGPIRSDVDSYKELIKKVKEKELEVNQRWENKLGYNVITNIYSDEANVKPPQNYAFMREGDVVLMPLIEDGMNLVFNEAVLASQNKPYQKRGIIAVSNCGAEKHAHQYGDQHGLIRIDPYDKISSAKKIHRAIKNKYNISDALVNHIKGMDVNTWRDTFLTRLREIKD